MARLVRLEKAHPEVIEIGGERIAICQCGLAKRFPFCDGSHRKTHTEEEGKLYSYESGKQKEITEN